MEVILGHKEYACRRCFIPMPPLSKDPHCMILHILYWSLLLGKYWRSRLTVAFHQCIWKSMSSALKRVNKCLFCRLSQWKRVTGWRSSESGRTPSVSGEWSFQPTNSSSTSVPNDTACSPTSTPVCGGVGPTSPRPASTAPGAACSTPTRGRATALL